MSRFSRDAGKQSRASSEAENTPDLASLFNYPNLEHLFEKPDFSALEEMRARLKRTLQSIERVLRHGSKAEVERAVRAAAALRATLELLDELQQSARSPGK
ncbi:MAG TPA: hypothetical protein VGB73_09895 [Pyrinomonadaceae bacterium]|jgi:hypothetical protein